MIAVVSATNQINMFTSVQIDWLNDFNGMSNHLELFYDSKLEKCECCMVTFIFSFSFLIWFDLV